jgi:hypothetical protein
MSKPLLTLPIKGVGSIIEQTPACRGLFFFELDLSVDGAITACE